MGQAARDWIERGEALERLGVKSQTLYAYVSRGRIAARPDPENPRRSLYAAADVARLKGDTEAAAPISFAGVSGRGEASIESAVSVVARGRLIYRGHDAMKLAEKATLEDAFRILMAADDNPFANLRPRLGVQVPGMARAKMIVVLSQHAAEDATATGRDAAQLRREAAGALSDMVDAVAGPGPRSYLHQRLARGWRVLEKDGDLIRRALVLAADHEMDAAVLATRAAADAGAGPAAAALAGVMALTGPSISAPLGEAIDLVNEARRDPDAALARRFEAEGHLPGFGHAAYPMGDPRAAALLAAFTPASDLAAVAEAGRALTGQPPAFALSLALLARTLDLPRQTPIDLYLLGRTAGLLAHAVDQAIEGSPIRARLRYVGPEPGGH
ncbi:MULTISPECIES: citrate/2-methylcitrate synthase [Brevundimonas]|uniref:citrate/2-methylcitrate synthase n=1 Tax=Brevundimonas TaxID=41275 RepID=UPI000F0199C3|nr:citrate/2-methylcitrate synthase [Brevundimonas lutea]